MLKVTKAFDQRELVIINVGANKSHSGLFSPLYEDGTFFLMPIPEEGTISQPDKDLFPGCPTLRTYAEFLGDSKLTQCIPERYLTKTVHSDPEFVTFTYGDNPDGIAKAKAANLKTLSEGDLLFFFAGLTTVKDSNPVGPYQFYFVGFFEIIDVLPAVTVLPSSERLRAFGQNVHIKRGQADSRFFNRFWVWKGSNNSQLFRRAVLFDRELAARILLTPKGTQYDWLTDRSELQLIGSRARASRRIVLELSKRILLEQVLGAGNDVPLFKRLLER